MLIDFGLAYTTSLAEDKAVDLYVLERAITSAHSTLSGLVRVVLHQAQQAHMLSEYMRPSSLRTSWMSIDARQRAGMQRSPSSQKARC